MRDILTARFAVVTLLGRLDPDEAANLLRGIADELAPAGITDCSGWYALWCQVHGECSCARQADVLGDQDCPLHNPDSDHDPMHRPVDTAPYLSAVAE
ncbi:hypothetical protein [Actinoplanes rectilineatus]|uniref:hypothetical protein n=1 Tax=Actinoplanes rectilineatus TaxID=113571 RepID=UPI0005F285C5|nr:hypothetical protein [Actinoplanes rectilineatus]